MPAHDIYHDVVRTALEKDGWTITDDPYILRTDLINYEVDLGAEKMIAANKAETKILVEVKSFLRQSKAYEMHTALGQFNTYLLALQKQEPDRRLYLAVAKEVHVGFFTQPFIQELIAHYHVNLIVFDPEQALIDQWMP